MPAAGQWAIAIPAAICFLAHLVTCSLFGDVVQERMDNPTGQPDNPLDFNPAWEYVLVFGLVTSVLGMATYAVVALYLFDPSEITHKLAFSACIVLVFFNVLAMAFNIKFRDVGVTDDEDSRATGVYALSFVQCAMHFSVLVSLWRHRPKGQSAATGPTSSSAAPV